MFQEWLWKYISHTRDCFHYICGFNPYVSSMRPEAYGTLGGCSCTKTNEHEL
jgi:hypothetical protein